MNNFLALLKESIREIMYENDFQNRLDEVIKEKENYDIDSEARFFYECVESILKEKIKYGKFN